MSRKNQPKRKPRRWLEVNGKVNTVAGHFHAAGYYKGYASSLAYRLGMKCSELPLDLLKQYLGDDVRDVPKPENGWHMINRKRKPGGYDRDLLKMHATRSDCVSIFLRAKLTKNPSKNGFYY